MVKISMKVPLVEMDGDEMTKVLWQCIKEELIVPFIDYKAEYYDLGLENREKTKDAVTIESAEATKKYGVAVKCATITPNKDRVKEYNLSEMWKSPNGTIRAILDGTVFREPIIVENIKPLVKGWKKPIIIARHAYGDIYKGTELIAQKGDTVYLTVEGKNGVQKSEIFKFENTDGIIMGMYNTKASIESFAKSCFEYALDSKLDLWFSTKDTISKTYDHTFKDIFEEIFEEKYKEKFNEAKIEYFYTLIDDAVARVARSEGGFIWACKNYDGDVMSDLVATAFGSLAMMKSVLVSPKGYYEYEAAHGTVQRHYYKYLEGEETSTNSVATIFAWTGALRKRGELDKIEELVRFSNALEEATIKTIESGIMTKDLSVIAEGQVKATVNYKDFIIAIKNELSKRI
ncbi:NADP-dependent isocitrate dehydrogenase [uncultured Clostridium sp.]|jgi:isocitrate dehydrogenase|uniref:NADP-dependent isocitrate dehydrogenase n=1 Tax=uncultured Clostridium sp. TaxID=59620 RepID=UPI00260806D7|nr:NADP-dependent isocitrate dehydrogenase [uncultured Clostridium sp.]